jgi:hypothetical protein
MAKWMGTIALFVLFSCGNKKGSLSGDAPVDVKDFIEAFPGLKLPVTISDTSLRRLGDTTTISRAVFTQFVPDSALGEIAPDKKSIIKPVGKVTNEEEVYLLTKFLQNKRSDLAVFVFDKNNKFLQGKMLLSNSNGDGYLHSVNINKEPTFIIAREKITKDNQLLYSRTGYAYNKDAGFMVVVNDTNEDTRRQDSIINPIDTFSKKNSFIGDYMKDKKNFISLRDGKDANSYRFFVHFEKENGACKGELKGEMTIKGDKMGQYTSNGDPCVINFKFSGSQIQVKEEGSCGNHRDIKCFFNDSYTRKREAKPRSKKK